MKLCRHCGGDMAGATGYFYCGDECAREGAQAKRRKRRDTFPRMPRTRPWDYVDLGYDTPCWQWTGHVGADGYGLYDGWPAHRFVYVFMRGPIDDDLVIDHLCRNHGCVNPDHLEPVTQQENIRRGWAARRDEGLAA